MGKEKFPHPSEIPWDKIREIRVSSDRGNYSFEFDINGRKQKMTFSITPSSTAVTLSTDSGSPIVHATQKGRELKVLDFTEKLSFAGKKAARRGRLSKMRPVRK